MLGRPSSATLLASDCRRPATEARVGPRWQRSLRSFFPRVASRVVRCEEPPAAPFDTGFSQEADASGPADTTDRAANRDEGTVQFEMFSREWQNISQQDNWDGFRIEAANQVTKFLQAAHTLFLGTQLRECGYIYQFGPAFQSEDQRTMLVARAGLDGSVNGRAIQKIGSGMEVRASTNSNLKDAQRNMHEGTFEYTGNGWCMGTKLAWQSAWLMSGAFTQRITPSLQLGGDLTLVLVNGCTSIGQVGARYTPGRDAYLCTLSRTPDPKSPSGGNLHECRLSFTRKLTERLAMGTEYKYTHHKVDDNKESGLQLAYEYTFRQARIQGLLDSEGKVSCSVSDFVGFGFSGMIDYVRGDYKFGVVMHVLPPQDQPPPN